MERVALTLCSLVACLAFAGVSGAQAQATSDADVSGVWWTNTYTPHLLTNEGKEPPLTPEGRKLYEQNQAAYARRRHEDEVAKAGLLSYPKYVEAMKNGSIANVPTTASELRTASDDLTEHYLDSLHRCLPPGPTRLMASPYPFRIVQAVDQLPQQIGIVYEMNPAYRIVRMNVKHANPERWDPSFLGDSVGHWEGGTLVIDTRNLNGKITLDRAGLPASDQLRVIERLRKIDGGKRLEALITIEDPVMYAQPWTTRLEYDSRPDVIPRIDRPCDEVPRDVSHLKGMPVGRK